MLDLFAYAYSFLYGICLH